MKRWTVWVAVCAILVSGVAALGAQESDLDPLLKLLVEQSVITMEQALAVQAEYDRRRAAEQAPAAAPPQPATVVPPPAAPALPDQVAEATATDAAPEAATTAAGEKWYDRFDFKGDLRLRGEFFKIEGISTDNYRERFRARFRAGMYTEITDWMDVGFQVRSGDPDDPVSDNSTFDGGFSLIPISISEAYAGFHPTGWLDLTFGKFDAQKKWVVSDMQWDDDVTVAGAMEEFSIGPLKFDLYQYLLEEDKATSDAYLLGAQLYGEFGSESIGTFKVGGGFDNWVRPQMVADLTLEDKLQGNPVTNLLDDDLQLISDFEIANLFATWSWAKNERWPVKFSAFGYLNTGAKGLGEDYDKGYFLRLQVGDYKKKYQMMFRATRYYSEPDALFYVFAQSDTIYASDVDGYRFDFRLGLVKKSYFNLTWYHTKPVYALFPTMDRLQVDYIIAF